MFAGLEDTHPDCSGADEAFAIIRAMLFLARHLELMRKHPDQIGPNVKANIEEGARIFGRGCGACAVAANGAVPVLAGVSSRAHDIVLAPTCTISPRPWRELYPAEIDGKPTRSYFHWLALAYAVTLAGHPALSLPVGRDPNGMPFGIQIIGPRGGDALVFAVAAALETMLAGDARTARPVPDIGKLKSAPPIASMEGFRAFD